MTTVEESVLAAGAGPSLRDRVLVVTGSPAVRGITRWVLVATGTLSIFAAFLLAKGADPVAVLESMWETSLGSSDSIGETCLRATPILLAALATAVPARAGLFNL
ncbi:MAG TPA: hypothetical protein PK748_11480, partial [Acidimicrobiales bacterium]|nr:hypothetical protein [Acidimicrobiales bacterium]